MNLLLNKYYNELESLIRDKRNKELECRSYLKHIPHFLFRETVSEFVYIEKEYRGNNGDSDYIISARVSDEAGVNLVKAYIWELKSPQCYIFEKDSENRLRPTKELIQAENQLLHYYHEYRGSDQFKDEFQVTHPDNVSFGGIIIGSYNTKVKNSKYDADKERKLYEKALKIRKAYIYDRLNIRLITWDTILEQLRPINKQLLQTKGRDEIDTKKVFSISTE